ncbi:SLT [Burkholderia cenocepacia PC184]|nr:SLT [Burkholderia cenocepacia PC184]
MPRHTTRLFGRHSLILASTIALACALCGVARADCLDDAAAFQHVSVALMRGIAQVESGMNPNAVNTNTNGTVDIGLMQINSTWLPTLAREGITRESLFDACTNAYVGAWILSQNIRQLGPNWNAIGAYNSASPDKRLAYARKVYDAIRTMPDSPDTPMPILPPSFTPPQQAQTYNPFASLSVSAPPVTRARTISPASPPAPPQGGPAGPAGTYNFGWTVTGADQAKPTQVFDDGARVYVQFSDMKHVPAIFTETSAGRVLMSWELQFPYAVVTRPAQTLIFQLGPFEARAQRSAAAAGMTAQSRDGRHGDGRRIGPGIEETGRCGSECRDEHGRQHDSETHGLGRCAVVREYAVHVGNGGGLAFDREYSRHAADGHHVEHAATRAGSSTGRGRSAVARQRRRAVVHLEVTRVRSHAYRGDRFRAVRGSWDAPRFMTYPRR